MIRIRFQFAMLSALVLSFSVLGAPTTAAGGVIPWERGSGQATASAASPMASLTVDEGWTSTDPAPGPISEPETLLLPGGRVMVISADTVAFFDPRTRVWTPGPRMTLPRALFAAVLMQDGRVLVAGGDFFGGGSPTDTTEIYDPHTNSWAAGPRLGIGRTAPAAIRLWTGKILVVGGEIGAEILDPATMTWSWVAAPNPRFLRLAPKLIELSYDRILLTGGWGFDFDGGRVTSEIYEPQTNTWHVTGPMAAPQDYPGVAEMNDGRVISAGSDQFSMPSVQLFDPLTEQWALVAEPIEVPSEADGVTVSDGRVVFAGNLRKTGVFDPVAASWNAGSQTSVERERGALAYTLGSGLFLVGGVVALGGDRVAETTDVFAAGTRTDIDGDGYEDALENAIGEERVRFCSVMRADVKTDLRVNVIDLQRAASGFGTVTPSSTRSDQNGDGSINAIDLMRVALQFGRLFTTCD